MITQIIWKLTVVKWNHLWADINLGQKGLSAESTKTPMKVTKLSKEFDAMKKHA